jgi:hypothetical protein
VYVRRFQWRQLAMYAGLSGYSHIRMIGFYGKNQVHTSRH